MDEFKELAKLAQLRNNETQLSAEFRQSQNAPESCEAFEEETQKEEWVLKSHPSAQPLFRGWCEVGTVPPKHKIFSLRNDGPPFYGVVDKSLCYFLFWKASNEIDRVYNEARGDRDFLTYGQAAKVVFFFDPQGKLCCRIKAECFVLEEIDEERTVYG